MRWIFNSYIEIKVCVNFLIFEIDTWLFDLYLLGTVLIHNASFKFILFFYLETGEAL